MNEVRTFRCVILGGGGHARVIIDCIQATDNGTHAYAVVDSNPKLWGTKLCGVPIRGGDDQLAGLIDEGVESFVVGLGGTRDNRPRARLFDRAYVRGLTPLVVVHPSARLSRWATIGAGSQLLPAAVVNAGAHVGMNVIVNTGSIVEHDCRIGDHVHIATGAVLASTVHVGARAHIGAGATIRQGIVVGQDAVVGAGAVVVHNVEAGQVVIGVPARPQAR